MKASTEPPIARLMPEILLDIFDLLTTQEHESNAPLISCILCCQRWKPLAASVLYRHVVLRRGRLALFVENHMSCQVTSLTLKLEAIYIRDMDPLAAFYRANECKKSLRKLNCFIKDMKPTSVSVSAALAFLCTITPEVAALVDGLPECCTGLEINLRYPSRFIPDSAADRAARSPGAHPHLCDSLRTVLPQLKHLRLCLPTLCASAFSANSSNQELRCQPIRAPLLKTCLISLSFYHPLCVPDRRFPFGSATEECRSDYKPVYHPDYRELLSSALVQMENVLRDFSHLNSRNLERFWIMETKMSNYNGKQDYAAWMRRDFKSNASYLIPVWGSAMAYPCVTRVPSSKNPEETKDLVVLSQDRTDFIAEGGTWVVTREGGRIPARGASQCREDEKSGMGQLREDPRREVTMPRSPGDLMQQWYVYRRWLLELGSW
ncbi:hypothetical protein GGR58DRAFT_494743 [Xylaria digitata]|nr:hypothetical protein GGR58DRAFT_494743 [Xylaria digitata]